MLRRRRGRSGTRRGSQSQSADSASWRTSSVAIALSAIIRVPAAYEETNVSIGAPSIASSSGARSLMRSSAWRRSSIRSRSACSLMLQTITSYGRSSGRILILGEGERRENWPSTASRPGSPILFDLRPPTRSVSSCARSTREPTSRTHRGPGSNAARFTPTDVASSDGSSRPRLESAHSSPRAARAGIMRPSTPAEAVGRHASGEAPPCGAGAERSRLTQCGPRGGRQAHRSSAEALGGVISRRAWPGSP